MFRSDELNDFELAASYYVTDAYSKQANDKKHRDAVEQFANTYILEFILGLHFVAQDPRYGLLSDYDKVKMLAYTADRIKDYEEKKSKPR
jgi:hypothetical protein